MSRLFAAAMLIIAAFAPATVASEGAGSFYGGKSIRWIVPYRAGGGYDQYSRLMAPFIEKYTGSRVEILNMPGAGGMKGAKEVFRSPSDGLHIGLINGGAMVGQELAGIAGLGYVMSQFSYIGRVAAEDRVLVAGKRSGFTSVEDLLADDAVLGSTGIGGTSHFDAQIAGLALNADWRLVSGFDSSVDLELALARGDIDAMWGSHGSVMNGIRDGEVVALLRLGAVDVPELEDVPSITEHLGGGNDLIEAWSILSALGRTLVAPPGVAPERLAYLREAFHATMSDPDFVAKAGEGGRDLAYMRGADIGMLASSSANVSGKVQEVLGVALTYGN